MFYNIYSVVFYKERLERDVSSVFFFDFVFDF